MKGTYPLPTPLTMLPAADSLPRWPKWATPKPGASSGSSMWVAVEQTFGPSFTSFPRLLVGSWIASEVAGTQMGTYMGCGITSSGLTCNTITLAPSSHCDIKHSVLDLAKEQ